MYYIVILDNEFEEEISVLFEGGPNDVNPPVATVIVYDCDAGHIPCR